MVDCETVRNRFHEGNSSLGLSEADSGTPACMSRTQRIVQGLDLINL